MAVSYEHAPFGRFEVRAMQDCRCEIRHPERRNHEGSRHSSPWILSLRSRMTAAIGSIVMVLLLAGAAFAAPKSASAYYSDAAFQYIENRLPSAEITCNEGLQYYPNDQKLQMLLDRIHEAKDEQKNENKKNDKNQDNNQDQNQDQNKDQNQDQQNQDQNGDGNSSGSESSSSQGDDQNQNQNGGGQSSSSQEGGSSESNSSDSNGGAGEQPEPEQPEEGSSDSQGDSSNDGAEPEEQPVQMGEMSPEEAAQLLKDFDEQNGERKPWKPIRGQARPAKDW